MHGLLFDFQGDVLQQQRVQREAHPVVAAGQGRGAAQGRREQVRPGRVQGQQQRQDGRQEEQEVGAKDQASVEMLL